MNRDPRVKPVHRHVFNLRYLVGDRYGEIFNVNRMLTNGGFWPLADPRSQLLCAVMHMTGAGRKLRRLAPPAA